MTNRDTIPLRPLRVAIVGAGPAGFFAADALLKAAIEVEIDIYDKKPVPYGLVRFGVAPDHANIKAVTKTYDRILQSDNVRFFGNVNWSNFDSQTEKSLPGDVSLEQSLSYYDQVLLTVGAPTDFNLGLPGEDELGGVHGAREFVGWFNCDSQCADLQFNSAAKNVFIIGVGNVALDVARVLIRPLEELAQTDIADHSLSWLSQKKVKDIHLVARRGPLQLACTYPELKEITAFEHVSVIVNPEDFSEISPSDLEGNKNQRKSVELLQGFIGKQQPEREIHLHFDFFRSPVAFHGAQGELTEIELVKNKLSSSSGSNQASALTGSECRLPAELVFRAIRYRGEVFPGLPFDNSQGVIPNEQGRVRDVPRVYVAGWIKRGANGIIGTNKPDAVETVRSILSDAQEMNYQSQPRTGACPGIELSAVRGDVIDKQQWFALDREEIRRGEASGRNRVRFIQLHEMLSYLAKSEI